MFIIYFGFLIWILDVWILELRLFWIFAFLKNLKMLKKYMRFAQGAQIGLLGKMQY